VKSPPASERRLFQQVSAKLRLTVARTERRFAPWYIPEQPRFPLQRRSEGALSSIRLVKRGLVSVLHRTLKDANRHVTLYFPWGVPGTTEAVTLRKRKSETRHFEAMAQPTKIFTEAKRPPRRGKRCGGTGDAQRNGRNVGGPRIQEGSSPYSGEVFTEPA
jgi:hypothetical protein